MTVGKTVRNWGEAAKAFGWTVSAFAAVFGGSAAARAAEAASAGTAAAGYTPMKPTPGIGMPVPGAMGLQQQFSPTGEYGAWIHHGLLWVMGLICLFVLILLLVIVVRFNRRANPVPSKTSHNTILEVVWTLLPVLILVGIAIPSIDLIAKQYKPAPKTALTIKVTGNQWFWTYGYPDNGDFEVVSNMLNIPGQPVINNGVREVGSKPWDGPSHLEVDNRMVVPVGEPIRLQITAADVIHSFAVPSLWFKLDAVPGRINEKVLVVEKPGVYYGQCSELCGAKHGYMPIAVEALPRPQYDAWVLTHAGGVIDSRVKAAPAAPAPAAAAEPAPAATAEASQAAAGDATAAAE
ncbi:cytochrome c oxidase subunit II [Novosphingobium clariflavum]|uniref:Cytochrome c oxidase subunit 2 n=1 Tax=Novosphingobium clariflavum TaxID=2029884 RepID=A0ABV6S188_9SPHN|nr:cytochrome c oxidase subunit II [Novosphingobium clariflavum]